MSQNLQNLQNIKRSVGGSTTVSPPESRRLAGFPRPRKGMDGFVSFVIKIIGI
jgi:hypothetical protein